MEVSHEPVSEERKRELIAKDLREDPYLRIKNPTIIYIQTNLSKKNYDEIRKRTSHDDLYKGEVTDETINWFINTFVKGIPWRECFYKQEPDKRG